MLHEELKTTWRFWFCCSFSFYVDGLIVSQSTTSKEGDLAVIPGRSDMDQSGSAELKMMAVSHIGVMRLPCNIRHFNAALVWLRHVWL